MGSSLIEVRKCAAETCLVFSCFHEGEYRAYHVPLEEAIAVAKQILALQAESLARQSQNQ